jgi:hypothetical protein
LPEHRRPETVVFYDLKHLGAARDLVEKLPVGTAMLSCVETAEEAKIEAKGLGANRLIILDENGQREVAL